MSDRVYLAFYKGRKKITSLKTLMYYLFDAVTRLVTKGQFSHVEIAIHFDYNLYDCYSSSNRDGGVRHKQIELIDTNWELVEVDADIDQILAYFAKTEEQKYDLLGAIGAAIPFFQERKKQFCSEWVYNALTNTNHGWQFNPVRLYLIATDIGFSNKDSYYTADKVNNLKQNTI